MKHEIIEHFKKFHGIRNMTEDYQIDIDWAETLVKDLGLVKNCSIPDVVVPKGTFTATAPPLPKETKPINMHTNSGKKITRKP